MVLLQPKTAEFLQNIEQYTPKTPPKPGYILRDIAISERTKRQREVGNRFLFKMRKHFPLEEIKTGRFFDRIKMDPFPQYYAMVPIFYPSSDRFGCLNKPTHVLAYFYFQCFNDGIGIFFVNKNEAFS